ncbi:MAG: glutathione S-transferase family protein [Pseudomonadota bacterium]
MSSLTFYTNPRSRGQIIRWMLEEVGVAYDTVLLEYGTTMKAPEYLAINPMGKVPAIRHNGTVVTEAAAICAYLADQFPSSQLAPPPSDPLRGTYYRWLFFGAGPQEMAATSKALNWQVAEGQQGMVGFGSLDATFDTLAGAVAQGPWLCGEQFTAADVYVGSAVLWGMQFGTIPRRPEFERYAARLQARPAAQRAQQLDAALLK